MKNIKKCLLGIFIISTLSGYSQVKPFDSGNARDGESVEYCFQHKKNEALKNNAAYMQSIAADEVIRQHESHQTSNTKGTIYKIPVVFHLLHNNGVENISDEQIFDQLTILNRDFRKLNADAANVHADFQGMPSDVEIEFVIATKAPNGACFNGITRTLSALSYDGADGGSQVNAIVSGNNVYNGQWAGNKYLNVFICGEIGGAAGYTMKPSNWVGAGMDNGIWILHSYVGSIGTSSVGTSRAFTHEVGHWLNLDHTWGGNNNPGNTTSCSTDDAVQDTPNCIGVTSCALNANTCNSVNAYWTYDVRDNVENYMDYSYCSKMFTAGQVARMRAAITSSVAGRNNLHTTANLNATGANGTLYLCKAEFSADKMSICVGESVQFSDDSYNSVNGWTWSFPSGTPSSSTTQNPLITYSTPGVYEVILTATDGTTTDAETKTGYIRVLPASSSLPFFEGFENYSTLSNLINWQVTNANNNNAFTLENTISHSGTKCVRLTNFGQTGANSDELIASPVDLSNVTAGTGGVTLSFRYAYRKRLSADTEWLKVFVTSNCGDTWVQRKTIGGNQLSSIAVSSAWTPTTNADWTTVHMINVTAEYWVDNFRYKFEFEGNNGNNFFLDDINIYNGAPSDNIVLGIAEQGEIDELSLYPNPTEGELNLHFSVNNSQIAAIQIQDLTGKIVKNHTVNAAIGSNLVMLDTANLAAGTYFITLKIGESQKVMQFVVK
jgi:PKD repeat protein